MPKRTRPRPRQAARPRIAAAAQPPVLGGEAGTNEGAAAPAVAVPTRTFGGRTFAPRPMPVTDYSYVKKDLLRIAIIAVLLFGGMGVLKLVLGG